MESHLGKTEFVTSPGLGCLVSGGEGRGVAYSVHFTERGAVCFVYGYGELIATSGADIAVRLLMSRGAPRAHCEFLFLAMSDPVDDKYLRTVVLRGRRPGIKSLYRMVNNPEGTFLGLLDHEEEKCP